LADAIEHLAGEEEEDAGPPSPAPSETASPGETESNDESPPSTGEPGENDSGNQAVVRLPTGTDG
jgi:hypothetical protein